MSGHSKWATIKHKKAATDAKLVALYDGIIPTLNHLFTHLARDWHDIDAKDKDVVTRLAGHDSFPDWAVPLKEKYINQHRAWNEADDITYWLVNKDNHKFVKDNWQQATGNPQFSKKYGY